MEEKLIGRLESAVARLEALSVGFQGGGGGGDVADAATDPSIIAFDDLMGQYVARVSAASEKIGGPVLEVTKFHPLVKFFTSRDSPSLSILAHEP